MDPEQEQEQDESGAALDVNASPSLTAQYEEARDANAHLRPSYALGAHMCGRQFVEFVSENVVVYPVAHHLCLFHMENRAMEFLHPTQSVQSIQCFHISTNRELIAVVEVHHATSIIVGAATASQKVTASGSSVGSHGRDQVHVLAIYKASTRTRLKTIALPHNSSVVSCCFSSDNKFLAMLEDAPTHNVTYWKVSTGKLIASCKCPSRGSRIFICPSNPNYISVSGPMILKYWLWTNNDFKIGNFLPQTREQEHFVDHLWLKEHMIAVSERGMLLCFRSTSDSSGVDLIQATRCHQPSFVRLECLASHSKGFVLGGSAGFFSLYESSDDPKDPFAFVRTVCVGEVAFECITISSNLESIVACTKSQEFLTFSMGAIDTVQEDRIEYRDLIRYGNQLGGLLQVDVCLQRPILASCGIDKSIRLWNYELRNYEVSHQCADEPIALSLHPTGFQLIVTFKERLRLFQILQETLRQIREVPVKSCRAVRFANGGHMFACAAGLTVSVYRTYTCEQVHTFSGHIGAVRTLSWTKDDVFLYSGAHDGSIYRWNISSGSRCEDVQHIVKQCQYSAVVADERDPKIAFVAGTDGKVRELYGGEETRVSELPVGISATSLVLTKDSKRLFAGTNTGAIVVFALPLTAKGCAYECCAHSECITSLKLSEDGEQLFTSSEDGSMRIFKILSHSAGGTNSTPQHLLTSTGDTNEVSKVADRKRGMLPQTDAVMVAREDLEEQRAALVEMQQRFDQVKADVEFALHRKENEWIDRLRVIKEEAESLMVQERVRYEELEHRHQLAQRKHAEELSHKEASHVKMTQELENQYERKLAQEMTRYDALSETLEQTRQRCEALIEAQDTQNRNTLHAERKTAYNRTKEQNDVIKRLHDDLRYNHVKFEEVLHQEESDYEQELQRLRSDYEKQLELERQNTAIKQGLLSATNTKLESLKKKMQELKASSHARDILLATERAKISKLEAAMAQYEKHFDACKFSMSDKEKEIGGLKSSNRILENFRNVLHHRIDNLEAAKAPMQEHMSSLEHHIHDMQTELADEYQMKATIQQDLENKDTKIKMLLHEVKMLRQNLLKKEYSMSDMVREFTRMAQMTNSKDVETAIKDAYRVFVMGETVQKKPPKPVMVIPAAHDPTSSPTKALETPSAPISKASPSKSNNPNNNQTSRSNPVASPMRGGTRSETPLPGKNKVPTQTSPVVNQCPAPITDEALGYDCKQTVDESVKQMEYMSKTITTLRTALENTKTKADRIRRDAVAEGSILIEECNKLRKENKTHLMHIRELEHQLSTFKDVGSNLSPSKTGISLRPSASCPQINPPSPSSGAELTLDTISVNSPCKLAPLTCGTPSKSSRISSPASPAPRPRLGSPQRSLPFAKLEQERNKRSGGAAKVEELNVVVLQQKKEIQRLQMQVQLLLDEEQGVGNGLSLTLPTAPSPGGDFSRPQILSARIGILRPLTSTSTAQPLHSSFVLTPSEHTM